MGLVAVTGVLRPDLGGDVVLAADIVPDTAGNAYTGTLPTLLVGFQAKKPSLQSRT